MPEKKRGIRVHRFSIKIQIGMGCSNNSPEKKSTVGGFWAAALVFTKKWHKWRHKQKMKKEDSSGGFATLPVENMVQKKRIKRTIRRSHLLI